MLDAGNDDTLAAQTQIKIASKGIMPPVIIVTIKNIRRGFDFTPTVYRLLSGFQRILKEKFAYKRTIIHARNTGAGHTAIPKAFRLAFSKVS
jgi:hypothetical protein